MQHFFFFFFQAEDGIRDYKVTGVQTCALPIYRHQQLQRPPVLFREPPSTTELRGISADGNREQPRCDRRRGSALGREDRDGPASEPGGRLPVPLEPRGALRTRRPEQGRPD